VTLCVFQERALAVVTGGSAYSPISFGAGPHPHGCPSLRCRDTVAVPDPDGEPVFGAMLTRRSDRFIPPCIPTRAHKPPAGPDWVHEVKHDGYRLKAMSANSERLDQLEEGNAAGGHAGEVEAIPYPAVSPSMTPARCIRRLPSSRESDRFSWVSGVPCWS
jgi:hypothetical protein